MSDETHPERRDEQGDEPPVHLSNPWAGGWDWPEGGPDDRDAAVDLSPFPDRTYRDVQWER